MRSRYQFTTLSWSKDRRANKHLSDPNPCICFSTYILDLRFLSESRTCTHTPTHIYIHVHARNRRNSARVQLERRKEGKLKRKFCRRVVRTLRESQITGVWKHVWMGGKHRRRPESLDTARRLGQADLRATCQRARIINPCIPIYRDTCARALPCPRLQDQFCRYCSNDSRRRSRGTRDFYAPRLKAPIHVEIFCDTRITIRVLRYLTRLMKPA